MKNAERNVLLEYEGKDLLNSSTVSGALVPFSTSSMLKEWKMFYRQALNRRQD